MALAVAWYHLLHNCNVWLLVTVCYSCLPKNFSQMIHLLIFSFIFHEKAVFSKDEAKVFSATEHRILLYCPNGIISAVR